MKEDQKKSQDGLAPRSQTRPGFWKSLFARRWMFPVLYLGAAVLILGLMFFKTQDAKPLESKGTGQTATPDGTTAPEATVTASTQSFLWPVGPDGNDAKVSMSYYDETKDDATRAKSMVNVDGKYYAQQGVVIGLKSDKSFSVTAAAKGKVVRSESDGLMGKVVEIDHGNGFSTYYASLGEVEVKVGDTVLQGQEIAKTDNNRFEKAQLNHLHFEVKQDGKNIDPASVLPERSTK